MTASTTPRMLRFLRAQALVNDKSINSTPYNNSVGLTMESRITSWQTAEPTEASSSHFF
jgi:hypothetical protein